jgi:hypothetical protein
MRYNEVFFGAQPYQYRVIILCWRRLYLHHKGADVVLVFIPQDMLSAVPAYTAKRTVDRVRWSVVSCPRRDCWGNSGRGQDSQSLQSMWLFIDSSFQCF